MRSLIGTVLILLALLLGGCAARVQSFAFALPGNRTVDLREKPRLPREKQDLFAAGSAKSAVYTLDSAYTVSAQGQGFFLRYRGNYPGAELMIRDGHGDPLARSVLPMQPSFASVTVHVPLAAGSVIGGFQLISAPEGTGDAGGGSAASATGIRILGAGAGNTGPAFQSDQGVGVATDSGASDSLTMDLQSGVVLQRDGNRISLGFDQATLERTGVDPGRIALVMRYRYSPPAGSDTQVSGPGKARLQLTAGRGAGKQESSYLLLLRPGRHEEFFYASVLGFPPASISVQPESAGLAILRAELLPGPAPAAGRAAGIEEGKVPSPIPADIGTILRYPQKLWRQPNFELFAWNLFPQVLIMDTRSYAVQADFFRRLSFFEEKRGYRGKVLSDRELDGMHGWNGHNYNGDGLAPFFNDATKRNIRLTPQEELLRRIALAYGLIKQGPAGYLPGEGGILSVSQESAKTDGLLPHLLTHESLHGAYYMTPRFRDAVHAYWNGMTEEERSFWKLLFGYLSYDPTFSYLVVNEFQAYLLQQPLADVRWYFRKLQASRLESAYPSRKNEIEQFLSRYPDTFRRAATALGDALTRYTGLLPGDTRDLLPVDSAK